MNPEKTFLKPKFQPIILCLWVFSDISFPSAPLGKERSPIYGSSHSSCLDSPHTLCSSQGILEWDALASSISTTWELVRYADSSGFYPTSTESETLRWSPMICVLTSPLGAYETGTSLRTSVVIPNTWNSKAWFLFLLSRINYLPPNPQTQFPVLYPIIIHSICPSVQDKTSSKCSVYSHTRSHIPSLCPHANSVLALC